MTPDFERVEALFTAASEIVSLTERAAFLERECRGDIGIRQQVEAMLGANSQAAKFFGGPEPQLEVESLPTRTAGVSSPALGEMVGPYRLLEKLGEGGFGVVYLAEQTAPVRRRVALKVIKAGMDTEGVIARFNAERQALALMDHPNIAKVLDVGTTDPHPASGHPLSSDGRGAGGEGYYRRPYFVMELVRGIRITEYCDQAQLSTSERLDLFIRVCQAIHHAHQKGIIHRDIKPSNILVALQENVPTPKVIDFGIAKATEGRLTDATVFTQLHHFIGTPAYMSPEQAEMSALDIDTRSDIYSLGVLLYELLTGSTPFDAQELMAKGLDAMRKTIREKEPTRPSTKVATLSAEDLTTIAKRHSAETAKLLRQLRGDLDWIVMKCLEKDRARRYESASGLAADLRRHLGNEPVVARPPSASYRFQKMVRRNKAATVAAAGILAALALGLGLALAALVRERAARQREQAQTVRADTVASFTDGLLSEVIPRMTRQGNLQGALELLDKADLLAGSALSNAPAAEISLRRRLGNFYAVHTLDFAAASAQYEQICRLLEKVSDDQLPMPGDALRLNRAWRRLWAAGGDAGQEENARRELNEWVAKLLQRSPPDSELASVCLAEEANWHRAANRWSKAEELYARAYAMRPTPSRFGYWRQRLPARYSYVLSAIGKPARAEKVALENLALPTNSTTPDSTPVEMLDGYIELVSALNHALCLQGRFADATRTLEDQRRLLEKRGGADAQLVSVDKMRGDVLARSGDARGGLQILSALTMNPHCDVLAWHSAVVLAVAAGDLEAWRQLSRIAMLRFTSTAEGQVAFIVADGLLRQPGDETTLAVAHAMVDRVTQARDWSKDYAPWIGAFLAYREHRYADGLSLLNRYLSDTQFGTIRLGYDQVQGWRAGHLFVRAIFQAELGHPEEARHDFAAALQHLQAALGDKPGHDRGPEWPSTYAAEAMRREAEAVFAAKNLRSPEP